MIRCASLLASGERLRDQHAEAASASATFTQADVMPEPVVYCAPYNNVIYQRAMNFEVGSGLSLICQRRSHAAADYAITN